MKKHLQYAKYIFKHKWYVMLECFKEGLIWRGLMHDLSKFLPNEWIPYANFFYNNNPRDKTGYYKPTDTGDKAFDFAWLLHQKRNRHHWQWWILPEDEGGAKVLEIPEPYLTEMICDWIGAGKAQGHSSPKNDPYFETRDWWKANNYKMFFHPETEKEIDRRLFGENCEEINKITYKLAQEYRDAGFLQEGEGSLMCQHEAARNSEDRDIPHTLHEDCDVVYFPTNVEINQFKKKRGN